MRILALIVVGLSSAVAAIGAWRRADARSLAAWPCIARGHADLLIFGTHGRLFLRCSTCHRETPGWNLVSRERVR